MYGTFSKPSVSGLRAQAKIPLYDTYIRLLMNKIRRNLFGTIIVPRFFSDETDGKL